jgi:hypothetical protein
LFGKILFGSKVMPYPFSNTKQPWHTTKNEKNRLRQPENGRKMQCLTLMNDLSEKVTSYDSLFVPGWLLH